MSVKSRLFTSLILGPLLLSAALWLASCNTAPEEIRQTFSISQPEDLLDFERVVISLEDTSGKPIETLYDGQPQSTDEFSELSPQVFTGGQVVVRVMGYSEEGVTYVKTLTYDTDAGKVLHSKLEKSPDTRIVLGADTLKVTVGDTLLPPSIQVLPATLTEKSTRFVLPSDGLLSQIGDASNPERKWLAKASGVTTVRVVLVSDSSVFAAFTAAISPMDLPDTNTVNPDTSTQTDSTLVPNSVKFASDSATFYLGMPPLNLPLVFDPPEANRDVSWTSGDTSIASVADGKLIGIQPGQTTLIVQSLKNGDAKDTLRVRVKKDPPVWIVPQDTVVGAGLLALFQLQITQEYGGVEWFAWDALGDGVWDDSSTGLTELRLTWADPGDYQLRLGVRDVEGNVTDTSIAVTAADAPNIQILSPKDSAYVRDRNVVVSWSVDGVAQTTGTVEVLTQEGLNLIRRSAVGPGGGTFEAVVRVYLDTTAPAAPQLTSGTLFKTATPTWTWKGSNGGSRVFRFRLGESDLSGQPESSDTSFTLSTAVTTDQTLTLYVQERDAVGNWSATGEFSIRVDLTAPTRPVVAGKALDNTLMPTWTWTGDATGGAGVFRFALDQADITIAPEVTSKTYTPPANLLEGSHTFYVQERDSAGNWSLSAAFVTQIDVTPPKAPGFTSSYNSPVNTLMPTWEWGSGGGGNGTYRYKLNNANMATGTASTTLEEFTPSENLVEGVNTLYLQELDEAGNVSPTSSQAFVLAQSGLAGNADFSVGTAAEPYISFSPTGVAYVAFSDGNASDKATVMRLNGTTWQVVGKAGFSRGLSKNFTLLFNSSGVPYVSFAETWIQPNGGTMYSGSVMRLNAAGTDWEFVGGSSFDPAAGISIDFSATGELYAAHTPLLSTEILVRKLNAAGTAWTEVGGTSFITGIHIKVDLKVSPSGKPYVAWKDEGDGNRLAVKRLNSAGTGWEAVGGDFATSSEVGDYSLAFHPNGTPYIGFRDVDFSSGATVMRLLNNGSGWELVGARGFSTTGISFTRFHALRFAADGGLYLGMVDTYRVATATVAHFPANGTDWEFMGGVGQPGTVTPVSYHMALSPAGVPYMVFSNSDKADYLSVYRATFQP